MKLSNKITTKKTTIKIQSVRNFTFGHEKSPVIEFQGLSYHYLYGFYMAFVKGSLSHAEPLLSDAKVAKYVFKHLVCSDFAYDVAEVEDALAKVLRDEVARELAA